MARADEVEKAARCTAALREDEDVAEEDIQSGAEDL